MVILHYISVCPSAHYSKSKQPTHFCQHRALVQHLLPSNSLIAHAKLKSRLMKEQPQRLAILCCTKPFILCVKLF